MRNSIEELYLWLLHREASDEEVDGWALEYARGMSLGKIVSLFLRSPEFNDLRHHLTDISILHLHLEKCSGTTFREWLNNFISRSRTYIYGFDCESRFRTAQFVTGHISLPFAATRSYDVKVTVLRDPIERIISLYRFARSNASNFPPDDPSRLMSFDEWIKCEEGNVINSIDNLYVRRATGFFRESNGTDLMRQDENAALDLAQAAYRKFTFVGDQSNLSSFYDGFADLMKIPRVHKRLQKGFSENVSKTHHLIDSSYTPRPDLSESTIDRLSELTFLDYAVYESYRIPSGQSVDSKVNDTGEGLLQGGSLTQKSSH